MPSVRNAGKVALYYIYPCNPLQRLCALIARNAEGLRVLISRYAGKILFFEPPMQPSTGTVPADRTECW